MRALLGREPRGGYEIVVRAPDGDPLVLRNAPLLDDGTPMPTRYWLTGPDEVRRISRLEAAGGVAAAEAAVDDGELAAAHARYAAERDAALPAGHVGPRPSGGVGGTRTGVKCLHAHWAWHLAGGDDPVGRWIADRLAGGEPTDPSPSGVRVEIGDTDTLVRLPGGEAATIPWGVVSLTDRWLRDGDPPRPEALTNALGTIDDHLDDIARDHPGFTDSHELACTGPLAGTLARIELGAAEPDPAELVLERAAAEEIFRMVATEPAVDRAHNPGLPAPHVELVVAACCIVVAFMRRLHLDHVTLVEMVSDHG